MAITLSLDGYCVLADVQALMQQFVIDANSDPSDSEVEGFIKQAFAEINALLLGAGYAVPVAQAGGTLSGTITVKSLTKASADGITLNGAGVVGAAKKGDFFTVAGDSQPYMVLSDAYANASNEVGIDISPPLEKDAAAGAAVTYTAATNAALVLKQLNATMAAIQTIIAAYSGNAEGVADLVPPLYTERERLLMGIKNGDYHLPSIAEQDPLSYSISNVGLVRA